MFIFIYKVFIAQDNHLNSTSTKNPNLIIIYEKKPEKLLLMVFMIRKIKFPRNISLSQIRQIKFPRNTKIILNGLTHEIF